MQIKIALCSGKVVKYLVIGMVFFAIVSTGVQISKYVFDFHSEWLDLFNLDRELNFPTWYSAFMLGFCALLLRIIAIGKNQQSDRFTKDWRLLSTIFGLMAIDEIISLHEIFIIPEVSEALNLPWFLHSMWVIPGMLFVVWFSQRYSKFVKHLPAKSQQHFAIAACTYIGGALVMEMVGSHFAESIGQQHILYALIATVEEILEMTGIIMFIYALLYYLSRWNSQLELQIDILDISLKSQKSRRYQSKKSK